MNTPLRLLRRTALAFSTLLLAAPTSNAQIGAGSVYPSVLYPDAVTKASSRPAFSCSYSRDVMANGSKNLGKFSAWSWDGNMGSVFSYSAPYPNGVPGRGFAWNFAGSTPGIVAQGFINLKEQIGSLQVSLMEHVPYTPSGYALVMAGYWFGHGHYLFFYDISSSTPVLAYQQQLSSSSTPSIIRMSDVTGDFYAAMYKNANNDVEMQLFNTAMVPGTVQYANPLTFGGLQNPTSYDVAVSAVPNAYSWLHASIYDDANQTIYTYSDIYSLVAPAPPGMYGFTQVDQNHIAALESDLSLASTSNKEPSRWAYTYAEPNGNGPNTDIFVRFCTDFYNPVITTYGITDGSASSPGGMGGYMRNPVICFDATEKNVYTAWSWMGLPLLQCYYYGAIIDVQGGTPVTPYLNVENPTGNPNVSLQFQPGAFSYNRHSGPTTQSLFLSFGVFQGSQTPNTLPPPYDGYSVRRKDLPYASTTFKTTGINAADAATVSFYPNPSKDLPNLQQANVNKFTLQTVMGAVLYQAATYDPKDPQLRSVWTRLPYGTYFFAVELTGKNGTYVSKIIKSDH